MKVQIAKKNGSYTKEKGIEEEEAKEKERRWITRCKDGRVCGKEGQQGELGILKG